MPASKYDIWPYRSVTFTLKIQDQEIRVRLFEQYDRTPHVMTAEERDNSHIPYVSIRDWDYHPSGRLRIALPDRHPGERRGNWGDGKRQTLEEQLADAIDELERHAVDSQRRKAAAHRVAVELEERRQEALRAEEVRRLQERRAGELDRQLNAWTKARRLRDYCAAMETTIAAIQDASAAAAARRWLGWARGHADAIDPVLHGLDIPADLEIEPVTPCLQPTSTV